MADAEPGNGYACSTFTLTMCVWVSQPSTDGALLGHGFFPHDEKRKISESISTLPDEQVCSSRHVSSSRAAGKPRTRHTANQARCDDTREALQWL